MAAAHPSKRQRRAKHKARQNKDLEENAGDDSDDDELPSILSPDDPEHLCLLSMALKCWLRRSITVQQVKTGQAYMEEYLAKLPAVCCLYIWFLISLFKTWS